jgi:alpha-glucosidase
VFKGDTEVVGRSNLASYGSDDQNLAAIQDTASLAFDETTFDETWEQPWGEQRYIRNNYRELSVTTGAHTVRFRLFDDGLGFRYELQGEGELIITKEETQFSLPVDTSAWWIPALGQNHYEHLYRHTALKDIPTAHTPLTIEHSNDLYVAIHEAALYDYGAMNLVPANTGLVSAVAPRNDGSASHTTFPFMTPWRTITVASTASALGKSRIMLNLNEPSKITDTSWIQPIKFLGIWWAMFINYATWASGDKHGATTANALRYINAAAELGIKGLLIEGWNEGWDGDWTKNGEIMNLMQPYPDFDIHTVTSYAKSRGIDIIGHHETSGNISHYEWQLPEAYDYYKHFGVNYVKTGYVSPRLNTGDYHSSQIGVVHYQKTVELAAARKMMLDIHEPVKGTGIERTWPNLMTREGVMGQEYEGGAVTPEHATVLPFTRLLAGPLDYTPGLFNLSGTSRKVHSTLSKQLAFYVTMYSPMQMVADLPEHYEGHSAFQFIRDVPVDWEITIPLDGVIGDFYAVARQDRNSDDWYIGAVTDEHERTITLRCDYLAPHTNYTATIYRDADDAHWKDNPEAYRIDTQIITSADTLTLRLAPGGGCAIRITPGDTVSLPYPENNQ